MKAKRIVCAILATVLLMCATACIPYSDVQIVAQLNDADSNSNNKYDTSLFYCNNPTIFSADPSVIYISEEQDSEYGGYFYLYQNIRSFMYISDPRYDEAFGTTGNYQLMIMRSKNMSDWESCGVSNGFGLFYQSDSWINRSIWGPEIYFNEYDAQTNPSGDNKYYLYFAADSKINDGTKEYSSSSSYLDRFYIAVARSDTPIGPFSLLTSEDYYGTEDAKNLNGESITIENPQINFSKALGLDGDFGCIDPQLFKDPVSGKLYLYFTKQNQGSTQANVGNYGTNSIWVMEMKDMLTPDYSTLQCVSIPYYETVDNSGRDEECVAKGYVGSNYNQTDEGPINEGSFTLYHDGKYYLTYASTGNGNRNYDQKQAVSDSPMGPFVKIGNQYPALGANGSNDYSVGMGHNCYFTVGDELWAVYGKFADASVGVSSGRVTAFDRASWVNVDGYDFELLMVNGPTLSVQPLASAISGYKNVADQAEISVNGDGEYDGLKYLTDGFVPTAESTWNMEFSASGKVELTLTFAAPQTIKSILIYNSADYYYAFDKVDSIVMQASELPSWYTEINPNSEASGFIMSDIEYSSNYYNTEEEFMRQGGAVVVAFDEVTVTSITITLSSKLLPEQYDDDTPQIHIGEIVVLGK